MKRHSHRPTDLGLENWFTIDIMNQIDTNLFHTDFCLRALNPRWNKQTSEAVYEIWYAQKPPLNAHAVELIHFTRVSSKVRQLKKWNKRFSYLNKALDIINSFKYTMQK